MREHGQDREPESARHGSLLPIPSNAIQERRASTIPQALVPASADEIFEVVTRCQLGHSIRTLPTGVQDRFSRHLEGIVLPVKEKHRLRFLAELAGLSARLLEPKRLTTERTAALLSRSGYREEMVLDEIRSIESTFQWIRDIALVCLRSSKPSDYVGLLSRPGVDIERFKATMPFFAGDRRVRFNRIDMSRRRLALEMERLARGASRESARGLLSLVVGSLPPVAHCVPETISDWKVLHALDIAAVMMQDPRPLVQVVRSDYRKLIQDQNFFHLQELVNRIRAAKGRRVLTKYTHQFLIGVGLYRTASGHMLRFGKMFKVGPIEGYIVLQAESLNRFGYSAMTTHDIEDATALLASDEERTVQHELQHVFDKICYLEGSTGASSEPDARARLVAMEVRARLAEMVFSQGPDSAEVALREALENGVLKNDDMEDMSIRIEADRWVSEKVGRLRKNESIRRKARLLLDSTYRQAYGLTYQQMTEPFIHV